MATDIKIVIRASDAFSPAFSALDEALGRADQSGRQTAESLGNMEGAFFGMVAGTERAGEAASDFAEGVSNSFERIVQDQQMTLQEMGAQQEAATRETGERLLEIQAELQQRRHAQAEQAQQQERQQHEKHGERIIKVSLQDARGVAAVEREFFEHRLSAYKAFYALVEGLAESHGASMSRLAKSLGIVNALIDTYRAVNNTLASVPYPFNLVAAGLVLAQGLANAQKIRQVGVAHGGLEYVPREQTYLLDRGERVLSPSQNRDLTGFLAGESGSGRAGGMVVENLSVHILENATSGGALLDMEQEDLRQLVADRIIPALNELSRLGIHPESAENNT